MPVAMATMMEPKNHHQMNAMKMLKSLSLELSTFCTKTSLDSVSSSTLLLIATAKHPVTTPVTNVTRNLASVCPV
jgi:hypothetical protein